jgi:hypothetical protein
MELYDVVKKLTGFIQPIGETIVDTQRLENLKELTELVDQLLSDIHRVLPCKNRQEYSMKKAGEYAERFLKTLKAGLEDL